MPESRHIPERKIGLETQRLIGKIQLQEYGSFCDTYNRKLTAFKKKLTCVNNINSINNKLISFKLAYFESESVLNLVYSDNKLLSRLLASLASICIEMRMIKEDAEEINKHFIQYEGVMNQNEETKPTISFIQKTFENLQKISSLLHRSQQVINLLLFQLNSLVGKGFYLPNVGSSFNESIDYLGNLLVCLLILDMLICHPMVKQHCSHYLMITQNLLHDPQKFKFSPERLKFLEKNVLQIQNDLLEGNIFKNIVQNSAAQNVSSPGVNAEFSAYIANLLAELESDEDEILCTQLWLQVNTLIAFQWCVFGDVEKKNLKKLIDVNKKKGSCIIAESKLWYPDEFLSKQIPAFSKFTYPPTPGVVKLNQVTTRSQNLMKETSFLISRASICMMNLERITKQRMINLEVKNIQEATKVLIESLRLTIKISELIKWILITHVVQNMPISKSTLLALCRLIEVLKCFQLVFNRNLHSQIYLIMLISQHLTYKTLTMILSIRKNLIQDKSYKDKQLDVLSALSVYEQTMKGPTTRDRLLVAKLALSSSGLPKDTSQEIKCILNRLELFNSFHEKLQKACNCSFLFDHFQALLPTYFTKILENNSDISKYQFLMSALDDCANLNEDTVMNYDIELKTHFLDPLIQKVETNLRLQTHLHLDLPPIDPSANSIPLNFSKISPVKFKTVFWSMKNEIEHYLSTTFYNLTTVVLHDWQTYGEMRRLAHLQYNLETIEDNLPMQTIEQGLDVLEIMRNINIFVNKYLYNLNSQVFIEEKSNNKHLNTINISHLANSIRTHGIGIMNTTVNFIYQFLQKKFFIFSQFMFDEQIKSRLLKDLKYFNDHKIELNQMYPYERAERFNNGIKKLGFNENGLSYLDLFRKLISSIGNAMGYVRLIRTGGRRCLSEGTCFIPDFSRAENLSNYFSNEEIPNLPKKAAECFTNELTSLLYNFEEATEYFKLLVDVFVPIFTDPKHVHLQNFFIIVPPLTINFIEHSLAGKERLNKKNKNDAVFTDDGFALGLAFIIELLKQEEQMNSLHWFHSIKNKFLSEKKLLLQQRTNDQKDDDKLQQTLSLTERRLASYEREFQLLYYTYKSARILFHS